MFAVLSPLSWNDVGLRETSEEQEPPVVLHVDKEPSPASGAVVKIQSIARAQQARKTVRNLRGKLLARGQQGQSSVSTSVQFDWILVVSNININVYRIGLKFSIRPLDRSITTTQQRTRVLGRR